MAKKQIVLVIIGFLSLFSCAKSDSELEITMGISESVLVPYKAQSCLELKTEQASSGTVTAVFDIGSKYFQFKYPKLNWKGTDTTLTVIGITMTPDKNNCGLAETPFVFTDTEIGLIFGRANKGGTAVTTLTGLDSWNGVLYGTATSGNDSSVANSCANLKLNGTHVDATSGLTVANNCNYVEGNDLCYMRGGGLSASAENCSATVTLKVYGLKTSLTGDIIPVKASMKLKLTNVF